MNRIRDLREDRNLRPADLAAATGIDQRTISNYETEKTYPDSHALIILADYFGVSIDYLVGRVEYDLFGSDKRKQLIARIKEELDSLQ